MNKDLAILNFRLSEIDIVINLTNISNILANINKFQLDFSFEIL